jgi:hypothetical protein
MLRIYPKNKFLSKIVKIMIKKMNNNMTKNSILMHGNRKLFCNFCKGADYETA